MKKPYVKCECGQRFWGLNESYRQTRLQEHKDDCCLSVLTDRVNAARAIASSRSQTIDNMHAMLQTVYEKLENSNARTRRYRDEILKLEAKTRNLQEIISMRDETIIEMKTAAVLQCNEVLELDAKVKALQEVIDIGDKTIADLNKQIERVARRQRKRRNRSP